MTRSMTGPARGRGLALLALVALMMPGPGASRSGPGRGARPALAQEVGDVPGGGVLRTAVRLSADTVRVGEPFTVGIVATASDSIRFPPLLETGERWEQLAVARIERGDGGETRAYYRLVAWDAGRLELPPLAVSTGDPGRSFSVNLPSPWVRSVLPADAEDVKLRGPRPPFGDSGSWWPWLAIAAILALAAWWWWRRRVSRDVAAPEPVETVGARERALAALAALREEAAAGERPAAAFYDRLEEILRTYLAESHEWPPTRPVRASARLSRGGMKELHRHAVMSRFAGVEATGDRRLADVDNSIDCLTKDAA
jgi:hypothetical protein